MTKLLSLDPLSWDMDCLLTFWPSSSLVPLVMITIRLVFWCLSLMKETSCTTAYILTEKSLKHLCSMRAWVPVSFSLSLSLSYSPWLIPWSAETVLLTLLPRLLRLSGEVSLCLHPPWEGAWRLRERCKSCVKDFIGFLRKPGSISLFLSFTISLPRDPEVPVH